MSADQAQLRAVGESLYGDRWQSALASDLGVVDRTVRRWLAGDQPVPPGVWPEIVVLLVARRERITQVIDQISDVSDD